MDTFGIHTLSCRFSAGRIPLHSALNDVVRRGLSAAGIPSKLEPSGLDRGDGKRPDGITVYPYSRGRCLIWDAMCFDTYASTIQFFKDLGRRLAVRFQDQRESDFLFQRVSLAILRGNAFSIYKVDGSNPSINMFSP